jgi:RNA polymerase sigma-70 factor (ECF subfamily)
MMMYRKTIEAFKAGDDLAFVSIYNHYKGGIYSFCLKMLGDRDQALDVMQDTFIRVYENRERLLHTDAFKSWLYTIARNQCLNRIRNRKRLVPLDDSSPTVAPEDTPVGQLEKSERIELVNRFLATLSPSYREVIILREWQNLSYAEIGAITRSTVSAVKSRLFKARRRLACALRPALAPVDESTDADDSSLGTSNR